MWERVMKMKKDSENDIDIIRSFYWYAFRDAFRYSLSKRKCDLPIPPSILKSVGETMNKKYDDPLCRLFVRKADILNGGVNDENRNQE